MINTLAYMNFEVGLLILAGVLVMFGGKKIPELFRGIGQGVGELKKGMEEGQRTLVNSIHHHETETHPTTPVVVEPVQTAVPATETKVTPRLRRRLGQDYSRGAARLLCGRFLRN